MCIRDSTYNVRCDSGQPCPKVPSSNTQSKCTNFGLCNISPTTTGYCSCIVDNDIDSSSVQCNKQTINNCFNLHTTLLKNNNNNGCFFYHTKPTYKQDKNGYTPICGEDSSSYPSTSYTGQTGWCVYTCLLYTSDAADE